MSHYYDLRFQRSLDKALEAARLALKSAKCVKLTDEAHAYGDKFAAAEVAVRLATSSSLAFAELLGLDAAAVAAQFSALEASLGSRAAAKAEALRKPAALELEVRGSKRGSVVV